MLRGRTVGRTGASLLGLLALGVLGTALYLIVVA
jgi:hypothetical protein